MRWTQGDSPVPAGISEELKKYNARQEDMQRNQRIEREGKALENQKSNFE